MPRVKKPTLKKRKDGRYRCKYHDKAFYGSSPEEAFALRDEFIRNEQRGFDRQTVSDYALPWLKRSYPSVADSTYTGLAIHLQHLVDHIGNRKLSSIVPSDIREVYSEYYRGLSNSYIRSAKQLYCALFDSAQADRLISYNPARDKSARPHRGNKPKERILTKAQRELIETRCTDHRMYPAVMAMLYAGLRPQECKALVIERDVDFENDTITIRETAHVSGTKYAITGQGKTEWANRTIPLFAPLKRALNGKKGLLISSADGKPVTVQAWKSAWESFLYNMEVELNGSSKRWHKGEWKTFDIVPYTLRHAFCAFCRDSGVELNVCRRWMGHSDAKMILKVYDSVSSDREKEEKEKVENRLNRVQNGGRE